MTVDPRSVSDAITPDGCSVELYVRIPPLGEAEVVHHRLADGAAVLDLGCGTGRIAGPLAQLGHPVVAVDESGAMLAQMPMTAGVRPVQGRIQDLRLDERFAAVLLASNLINTGEVGLRQSILATCCHHLEPGGLVFAQWRPPGWFLAASHVGALGDISVTQHLSELGQDLFRVVAEYEHDNQSWRHDYVARRLTAEDLCGALNDAGLVLSEWITEDECWFAASPG